MNRNPLPLLVLALAACTPTPAAGPVPTALPTANPSAPLAAEGSAVGAACTKPAEQAECAAGLLCLPAPGGYCTGLCGFGASCPAGAACIPTVRGGDMCFAPCAADGDCRAAEGYACDPVWKVCAGPGSLGPKPPVCEGPAPGPRARFSEPRMISTGKTSRYSFEPMATLLPSGDLVIVYTAMNAMMEPNGLETVVVRASGTVEAPRPLGSDRKRHFDPWITTFRGEAVLTWLGHDGGLPDRHMAIGLSRSKDGLVWSSPVDVLDGAQDCPGDMPGCVDKPMIASAKNKSGESLVVFYYSEATEGLRARFSADGTAFAPSIPVLAGAYGDVFVDDEGTLHVAMPTSPGKIDRFGDPRTVLELASSRDGGKTFGAAERVSSEGDSLPFYFSNAQIAVDSQRRRRFAAYPSGTPDGRWSIVLGWRDLGGTTSGKLVVNDDPACANHMKPTLALDPRTGRVHLVWTENRGGVGRLVYASCGIDGGKLACSPNEIVQDRFAGYSFVRHAPSWLGEYDALVVDAARRTLHVVFTAPVDEGGIATSRVFHATAKLD